MSAIRIDNESIRSDNQKKLFKDMLQESGILEFQTEILAKMLDKKGSLPEDLLTYYKEQVAKTNSPMESRASSSMASVESPAPGSSSSAAGSSFETPEQQMDRLEAAAASARKEANRYPSFVPPPPPLTIPDEINARAYPWMPPPPPPPPLRQYYQEQMPTHSYQRSRNMNDLEDFEESTG